MGKSNQWSQESRRKKATEGKNENLEKGTQAALSSPKSGHFETNINAKHWHIVSPDGKHYMFRNLNLWAESNYGLFGFYDKNDAYKIAKGLSVAKRGAEGKIQTCTYKGWTVIID